MVSDHFWTAYAQARLKFANPYMYNIEHPEQWRFQQPGDVGRCTEEVWIQRV